MKSIAKALRHIIYFFGALIPVVSSILVLNGEIAVIPVIAILFGLALYIGYCNKTRILLITGTKWFRFAFWGVLAIAVLARAYPLLAGLEYTCCNDLSDTGVHYYGAQQLFYGGLDQNIVNYEMVFPYLFPYTLTLSCFNYLLGGNIDAAIVVSNICFDLLGCVFCYAALRKMNRTAAKVGAFLWIVNPLSVVMCWLPLNIIVVNTLLAAAFYVAALFIDQFRSKGKLRFVFAGLFGLIIFVANTYRPVFYVFMIAFVITMLVEEFGGNEKETLIALAVVLVMMAVPTSILHRVVENIFGEDLLNNNGGWSLYVGSNYESKGQWTREDCDHFWGDVVYQGQTTSINEMHQIIAQEGVQRYSELSPLQIVNHFANKASILFSDSKEMAYDLRWALGIAKDSLLYRISSSLIALFFTVIALLSSQWMIRSSRRKTHMFFTLCYMGFFAAFLLVEVMNRYSSVFYAMFVFYSALQLVEWLGHDEQRTAIAVEKLDQ